MWVSAVECLPKFVANEYGGQCEQCEVPLGLSMWVSLPAHPLRPGHPLSVMVLYLLWHPRGLSRYHVSGWVSMMAMPVVVVPGAWWLIGVFVLCEVGGPCSVRVLVQPVQYAPQG